VRSGSSLENALACGRDLVERLSSMVVGKSWPGASVSTSMKTARRPKRALSRSCKRPAQPALSSRR